MSAPWRLAIVGLDHPHGAGWRRALALAEDLFEVVALVPRFGGATTSLEERYASLPRFETVKELLAKGDCDAALLTTPNAETPDAVVQLAEAGKHVLVEKPGAANAAEARRMADAVRKSGVAFQNGYVWRYDEGANRLRQMMADDRFGGLASIELTYFTSDVAHRGAEHYLFDRAASGAGFFNWLACHWLDLLFYLVAQPVVAVTARVGVFGATQVDVEDGGTAILELANGTLVTFTGGYWLSRWSGESRWSLRGQHRWVHWEPNRVGTGGHFEIHGPQPQFDAMDESFTLPADPTACYGGARTLDLLRDWYDAGQRHSFSGSRARNTPESTVAVLELIDTIYQSSAEGRRLACRIGPG